MLHFARTSDLPYSVDDLKLVTVRCDRELVPKKQGRFVFVR